MEVRLQNLTKVFPAPKIKGKRGADVYAVNEMTVTIPDGKLIGLLGPSGCGKSTTLYMIAGLHKPTAGQIWFGEEEVTNVPPENRGIGLVFQNYALYPHLTVRQNIQFPLHNVRPRLSKEEMEVIAQQMADLVDIGGLLDRKPKELSGGQQQRVAIARALAKRPQVLLLDEPLSNLDARLRLQTREEIRRIQRVSGVTTIFVTHDQEEAMSISDYIIVMDKGIVQQVDEPQTVYDEPINLFVAKFLGNPAINIFNGELKNGNLLIDGKIFDKGYQAKGEFSLLDEGIFAHAVDKGFTLSLEDYLAMLKGEATRPVMGAVADENGVVPTEVIPFELTLDNIFAFIKEHGYTEEKEQFTHQIHLLREEKGLNRPVKVGVRPEAFAFEKTAVKGKVPLDISYIEHIGRDISIIGNVHDQPDTKVRVIIPSEKRDHVTAGTIELYPKRFYVFEESGTRIK